MKTSWKKAMLSFLIAGTALTTIPGNASAQSTTATRTTTTVKPNTTTQSNNDLDKKANIGIKQRVGDRKANTQQSKIIATVSGSGVLKVSMTNPSVGNRETALTMRCDGVTTGGGGWNIVAGDPAKIVEIPYSGKDCKLTVGLRRGGDLDVTVVSRTDLGKSKGRTWTYEPFIEGKRADWKTTIVSDPRKDNRMRFKVNPGKFPVSVPNGFTGVANVKMTSCTTGGGSRDASTPIMKDFFGNTVFLNGKPRHIQLCELGLLGNERGIFFPARQENSVMRVTFTDDKGILAQQDVTITPREHHETASIKIDRPVSTKNGKITMTVQHIKGVGSAVHAPGFRITGFY